MRCILYGDESVLSSGCLFLLTVAGPGASDRADDAGAVTSAGAPAALRGADL